MFALPLDRRNLSEGPRGGRIVSVAVIIAVSATPTAGARCWAWRSAPRRPSRAGRSGTLSLAAIAQLGCGGMTAFGTCIVSEAPLRRSQTRDCRTSGDPNLQSEYCSRSFARRSASSASNSGSSSSPCSTTPSRVNELSGKVLVHGALDPKLHLVCTRHAQLVLRSGCYVYAINCSMAAGIPA